MVRKPKPKPDPVGSGEWLSNGAAAKAGLNKSISDAGWGQFAGMVVYKAVEAGKQVVFVDPRYTSQTCSCCGHVDRGNRVGVKFVCVECGHVAHADLNAAINILGRGPAMHVLPREATEQSA